MAPTATPVPPPAYVQQLNAAVTLLKAAGRVAVFTGAGMSADSGISTFRKSSGSLWSGVTGGLLLAAYGTPMGWRLTPGLAWSKYLSWFREPIVQAEPHAGHVALARLERERFPELSVVTMNVDGLHQRAGNRKNVAELHGTIWRNRCHNPAHGVIHQEAPESTATATPVEELRKLRCPTCGGTPRPDFVLFTEGLPASEWIKAERALGMLQPRRDVLLIVGTTGAVYPAASLPERCIRQGVRTIEVNMHRSPISDAVDVCIEGRAAEVLPALVEQVLAEGTKPPRGDGEKTD